MLLKKNIIYTNCKNKIIRSILFTKIINLIIVNVNVLKLNFIQSEKKVLLLIKMISKIEMNIRHCIISNSLLLSIKFTYSTLRKHHILTKYVF